MNSSDFTAFLVASPLHSLNTPVSHSTLPFGTYHQYYRLDDKLIAVGVIDLLPTGVSSVYCFYDPDYSHLSLGKYTALSEINYTKSLGLDNYYLGFYIHNCPKMSYKAEYRPAELLCPTSLSWYPLEYCTSLLDEFKFTPFDPLLTLRRREIEKLIHDYQTKIKKHQIVDNEDSFYMIENADEEVKNDHSNDSDMSEESFESQNNVL